METLKEKLIFVWSKRWKVFGLLVIVYLALNIDVNVNLEIAYNEKLIAEFQTTPTNIKHQGKIDTLSKRENTAKASLTSMDVNQLHRPSEVKIEDKQTVKQFIERWAKIAQQEQKEFNIPASISLAQGILESDKGNSRLSIVANNYFGQKCFSKTCKKGHCVNFKDDHHKDFFRKFDSPWFSWRAHSKLLQKKRYKPLQKKCKQDYECWCDGLQEAGYATDKQYGKKLKEVIRTYKLFKYD